MPEGEPQSGDKNELPETDLSQKEQDIFESAEKANKRLEKEKRARRLLGLDRDYNIIEDREKETILKSEDRIKAFEGIETTTNPPKAQIKRKQGIVSEIIKGNLIPEEILKKETLLYLGSGTDIEYALALGGRNIVMVDTIFGDDYHSKQEIIDQISQKLKTLINKDVIFEGDAFTCDFDFGEGPEKVKIELIGMELPSVYTSEEDVEKLSEGYNKLPEKFGVVLRFASGGINLEKLKEKVLEEGVVLSEDYLSEKVKEDEWHDVRLGHEKING